MAQNPNAVGKTDSECTETSGPRPEGGEAHKNSAATANQNGDQPGCRDGVMPEQEAPGRRRSTLADARGCSSSLSPAQRSSEELPRKNFQIPRKTRERKGGAMSLLFWTHGAFIILLLRAASLLASCSVGQVYWLLRKSPAFRMPNWAPAMLFGHTDEPDWCGAGCLDTRLAKFSA